MTVAAEADPIEAPRGDVSHELPPVVAGIDVARQALRPGRLRPGLLAHRTRLVDPTAQTAFMALTSMVPGTLAVGTDRPDGPGLLCHCPDLTRPVGADLAADEARFIRATGATTFGSDHGNPAP
jgi:multicomponent Na+:H+ antiporter subunit E